VYLPQSITWIAANAFYNCTSLTTINLSSAIKQIDNNAFAVANLTGIVDISGATILGTNIFRLNTNMTESIFDNHGRIINYARIAVTDRCNLRCFYCMPEEGIQYMPKKELLQFEELERLTKILTELGISKLRITGGEPFVRKDIMKFIESIHTLPHLKEIHIATNGTHTADIIPELKRLVIKSVNWWCESWWFWF
jgi:sulfatase maturation enzyme AslB (radical SAM superfamily)